MYVDAIELMGFERRFIHFDPIRTNPIVLLCYVASFFFFDRNFAFQYFFLYSMSYSFTLCECVSDDIDAAYCRELIIIIINQ